MKTSILDAVTPTTTTIIMAGPTARLIGALQPFTRRPAVPSRSLQCRPGRRGTWVLRAAAVATATVLLSTTVGPAARAQGASAGQFTREADDAVVNTDRAKILDVLSAYQTALNTSDVDLAVGQFKANGALLSPNAPTAIGSPAIRQSYQATFQAITLNITFEATELVFMAPNWAFLRSTSNGTIRINATGTVVPEANQELFLFKKSVRGEWKIARYSFSTTLPQ